MLPVDKYDKYTSQQIYTRRSRARYQPATLGEARFYISFLRGIFSPPTIDAKYLLVWFLMQIYLL